MQKIISNYHEYDKINLTCKRYIYTVSKAPDIILSIENPFLSTVLEKASSRFSPTTSSWLRHQNKSKTKILLPCRISGCCGNLQHIY